MSEATTTGSTNTSTTGNASVLEGATGKAVSASGQSGAGGNTGASWRDSLPEEMRNEASLSKFNDVAGLAKSFMHFEKVARGEKLPKPNDHWTDDDWNHLHKELGLPESVDKYELALPKDKELNQDAINAFKEQAHKAGVLPKQAQKLFDWFMQTNEGALKAKSEQTLQERQGKIKTLQQEWGHAFEKKAQAANVALEEFSGKDAATLRDMINSAGLGAEPVFVKFLAAVGESLAEDKMPNTFGGKFSMSPTEINQKIRELTADKAYQDGSHPHHEAIVQEVHGLYTKLSEVSNAS